jgi:5'-3' exonuclease
MSKQLATIITNIPMEFNLKDCLVHEFDVSKVRKIFDELNFKSLNRKLDMLEKRATLLRRGLPLLI